MEEKEIWAVINNLTLAEKIHMTAQIDGRYGKCERLGIKGINPQDNPRGGEDYFRSGKGNPDDGGYHPTAYPSAACMAMSWDKQVVYDIGKAMGKAAKANPDYIHCVNRPGVNMKRSPLCGRNFEYYSEDPVQAGELAGSYIQGMQSENVSACLKHYVANNQEFERMTTNAVMNERTLRELYLRVFEIALKKGKPWMVMTSYNKVNGEWVNSNSHVMEILRKDFGYDGLVVSDFLAIHHNKIESHKNTMDIELAPDTIHSQELLDETLIGNVDEKLLDQSIYRILKLYGRLRKSESEIPQMDWEKEHAKARETAEKSIVLLENNGVLPLHKKQKGILVAGTLAMKPYYMGCGSGHMNGYRIDVPYEEISRLCEESVDYVPAYELPQGYPPEDITDDVLIEQASAAAGCHEVVLFFGGLDYGYESESWDRKDIFLPKSQRDALDAVMKANKNVVLITMCGSVLDLSAYKGKLAASIYAGLAGEAFGGAVANILFGEAEPGGRLAETFPMCLEQTPAYLNFTSSLKDAEDVEYGEGIFIGYRWYDARKLQTAYPFGHGLSYTEFTVTDFHISSKELTPDDSVTLSMTVANTGNRTGSQVIQLYVQDVECIELRPPKELKAFKKVYLEPGTEEEIQFELGRDAFEFYSNRLHKWVVESGSFHLLVGLSAENIIHQETVHMQDGDRVFVYTKMTSLEWFLKNPRFHEILKEEYSDKRDMFDIKKNELTILLLAMPFYKLKDPVIAGSTFSEADLEHIINRMNGI